ERCARRAAVAQADEVPARKSLDVDQAVGGHELVLPRRDEKLDLADLPYRKAGLGGGAVPDREVAFTLVERGGDVARMERVELEADIRMLRAQFRDRFRNHAES